MRLSFFSVMCSYIVLSCHGTGKNKEQLNSDEYSIIIIISMHILEMKQSNSIILEISYTILKLTRSTLRIILAGPNLNTSRLSMI